MIMKEIVFRELLILINYTHYEGVNGARIVTDSHSRAATRCNEDFLADTRADGSVHSNDVFVGEVSIFHYLYFKKFEAYELVELVRGYDVSDNFSS